MEGSVLLSGKGERKPFHTGPAMKPSLINKKFSGLEMVLEVKFNPELCQQMVASPCQIL